MDPFEFTALTAADVLPTGFGTPTSDTTPQVCYVPPRRVIPIIFLPGIMGSNLRIKDPDRMALLGRKNSDPDRNIAWRPDAIDAFNASAMSHLTPAERQLLLDPSTTEVDRYNPESTDSKVDDDWRNRNVDLSWKDDLPLLRGDCSGAVRPKTAPQKARMRGWGEVYFKSYGELLHRVESRMQRLFSKGNLADGWNDVIGVDPARWGLDPSTPQKALTVDELKAITKDTFFPVHAIGYNWLVDLQLNARTVAERINEIIRDYREVSKRVCPGVIVVTHSMGGLLGRALIHPQMGKSTNVLGIVHSVQPALGAAAAYKRMRAGFEDPGLPRGGIESITAKIGGNYGDEVTAVLGSSAGALQLLPSKGYGNGWLRVEADGLRLLSLPAKGDPYEEIYKLRGKWYSLIPNEDWLNPAGLTLKGNVPPIKQAYDCLDAARDFHEALADTYHPFSYVHYGADRNNLAFGNVTWTLGKNSPDTTEWNGWHVANDTRQGTLEFVEGRFPTSSGAVSRGYSATIAPPDEAGDQTVPMRSADRQKSHGHCKAVFRQTGYDHQGSFQNEAVLAATLYSILRIAQRVQLP